MRVTITPDAAADLAELTAWISRDSVAAATRYGDALVAKVMQIGEMPLAFPAVPHPSIGDLRKRTFRSHIIIYRVRTEVEVLRIFDARRDYLRLLDEL